MIQGKRQPHAPLFLIGGKENFRSNAADIAQARWSLQIVLETIRTTSGIRVAGARAVDNSGLPTAAM